MRHTCKITNWVDLKSIKDLKVGDPVRSCRNGSSVESTWFTGIVEKIAHAYGMIIIDIKRDDGRFGGGSNGAWNTEIHYLDFRGYQIAENEWDL